MLSRSATRNNGCVPELPDLRILDEAFTAALVGRALQAGSVQEPLVMRGTTAELRGFEGRRLLDVRQRGKFLTIDLGPDRIVINAMLTGRLGLATPGSTPLGASALVLTFGPREAPVPGDQLAGWTKGATWLPSDEVTVELRLRDPKRMGKVYLVPQGTAREVVGWEAQGPDADDPDLDFPIWQERIRRHSGELHALLKNQTFVAGIGNAYKDEILWAARLAPFRRRASLAPEESERLWRSCRDTLRWAVGELRVRVPPRFEVQARDFLRVHRKGGQPCPRCGTSLSEVAPGGFVTTWCRACQV
jgi:formamidopyrimidine-DNA glycosylase